MTEYTPSPDDPLLSVSEVAERFNVTPYTVREWIKAGDLGAIKPRGRWGVPRSEMVRFANSKYGGSNE